jgi:hypothetical protein
MEAELKLIAFIWYMPLGVILVFLRQRLKINGMWHQIGI